MHPRSLRLSVRQCVPSSVIALGYTLTRPSADDTPPPLPAHQHSPRESVPLIRPPLTSPAPACGLAPRCTSLTSLHAAPNTRHLHELACQAHWRRFRRAPCPSTAVLPDSASCGSKQHHDLHSVTCCHLLFATRVLSIHAQYSGQKLLFCGPLAYMSKAACQVEEA